MVLEREGNSDWLFMWAFWYVKGSHLHSLELSREGTAISRILQTSRQDTGEGSNYVTLVSDRAKIQALLLPRFQTQTAKTSYALEHFSATVSEGLRGTCPSDST